MAAAASEVYQVAASATNIACYQPHLTTGTRQQKAPGKEAFRWGRSEPSGLLRYKEEDDDEGIKRERLNECEAENQKEEDSWACTWDCARAASADEAAALP
jgi:hypothetical protein